MAVGILATVLIVARVAHAIGMARNAVNPFRAGGITLQWLMLVVSAVYLLVLVVPRGGISLQGRDRARLCRRGSATLGRRIEPDRVRSWRASMLHGRVRGFRRCRRFYAGMGRLWLPCWNGIKFRAWMQIGEPTSRLHPKIAAGPFVRAIATVQNLLYTKYALQLHIVPVMFGPQVCGEI